MSIYDFTAETLDGAGALLGRQGLAVPAVLVLEEGDALSLDRTGNHQGCLG